MRSETSFALDGDLIVIDAVVIGPSGRANIQLVLDTGAVLTTLVPTVAQAIGYGAATSITYEVPDANESSFPQDIKKHFWESVKTSFAEAQVIIIENSHQLPGDGTLSDVNVVLFTGNDQGRRGFIPQAAGVA